MGGNPTKPTRARSAKAKMVKPMPQQRQAGNPPSRDTALSAYAAMLADPLNAPVVGKPDYNTVATNTARFRDVYDVTTNASGQVVIRVTPWPGYGVNLAASMTGSTVTGWGANTVSGYQTSMNTDNTDWRPLAIVVQWQPTLSTNTAAGKIFMGQYASGTNDTPLQDVSAYFDDEGFTATAKEEAITIARPLGEISFVQLNVGPIVAQFANIVVAISGMPAAAQIVGQLVVTRIVELIPLGTTLARMQATHTPCDMNDCCTAANIIGPGATRAWGPDSYKKTVAAALRVAMKAHRVFAAYSTGGVSELARMIGA